MNWKIPLSDLNYGPEEAAAAQRVVTKSSSLYNNSSWDLVDAVDSKTADLDDLENEELPEEMQNLTPKEKEEYVKNKAKERGEIQEEISKLSKEREAYVAEERKKKAEAGDDTLDEAIIKTIRNQAGKLDFEF